MKVAAPSAPERLRRSSSNNLLPARTSSQPIRKGSGLRARPFFVPHPGVTHCGGRGLDLGCLHGLHLAAKRGGAIVGLEDITRKAQEVLADDKVKDALESEQAENAINEADKKIGSE